MFLRPISNTLSERLNEPKRFIQTLIGPRQTGKTTIARQIISNTNIPSQYASADEPVLRDRVWIEQQWETARLGLTAKDGQKRGILILDEIKKSRVGPRPSSDSGTKIQPKDCSSMSSFLVHRSYLRNRV